MGKPLSFREIEFGLLAFLNVEINPDPIQQGSVRSPNRFGATEEPPIPSSGVTQAKAHLTGAACT